MNAAGHVGCSMAAGGVSLRPLSAALIVELLQPPDPPALMFAVCHRSEGRFSPLLKVLKGLAEYKDMSLGDLLEGIVLHSFETTRQFLRKDCLTHTRDPLDPSE